MVRMARNQNTNAGIGRLDLSRLRSDPRAHLCSRVFECRGALVAQCRVFARRLWRLAQVDGHLRSSDRQVFLQPVAAPLPGNAMRSRVTREA